MMTPVTYVHTLGDSTLDNLYWMLNVRGDNLEEAKTASVEGQLKEQLGSDYTIVSHAYDGFTTCNVLEGGFVGDVLPGHYEDGGVIWTDRLSAYVKEKASQDKTSYKWKIYFIHPLEKLRTHIGSNPQAPHVVVLSVGGNDFIEQLSNPIGLLRSVSRVQQQYFRILDELQQIKSSTRSDMRIILMFQYPLDLKNDVYGIYKILGIVAKLIAALQIGTVAVSAAAIVLSLAGKVSKKWAAFGVVGAFVTCLVTTRALPFKVTIRTLEGKNVGLACLYALMEKFYKPIYERAKCSGMYVVDQPNFFDPYDSELYLFQIEPSQKGGQLIAEKICEVITSSSPSPAKGDYGIYF